MNIQAMMRQAQKMQKDMMEAKDKIDKMIFESTKSFVTVRVNGKKEVTEVIISQENLDKEDIEILQDLIIVAINEANSQVDKETEKQMGKYTQGMPGLF